MVVFIFHLSLYGPSDAVARVIYGHSPHSLALPSHVWCLPYLESFESFGIRAKIQKRANVSIRSFAMSYVQKSRSRCGCASSSWTLTETQGTSILCSAGAFVVACVDPCAVQTTSHADLQPLTVAIYVQLPSDGVHYSPSVRPSVRPSGD